MNSSSKSSSSTESSTANYDNRVANESGIAIGAGGSYVNTFNTDVANTVTSIFSKMIDFSGQVLNGAESIALQSIDSSASTAKSLVSSNATIAGNSQLGTSNLLTSMIPVLVIGAIGIVIFMVLGKKR
jgi:hypothetical protein